VEIKRRSAGVGMFSNRAFLRLVGTVPVEQDDGWRVADRRYFSAESMRMLTQPSVLPGLEELLAAVCWDEGRVDARPPPHAPNSTT
jgi:hypothetical protein